MNAARSFLLLIGDDGALLAPPRHLSRVKPLFINGHGDEEVWRILGVLADHPRVPVLFLVDTLSQEFRREALPRLNFFDRRKLMARRLRQYFPASPHLPLRQLTAARTLKNNEALFICLHDGEPLATWMKRADDFTNPFVGVVPLPLACAGMLTRLMPEARRGWAMLLSWQRTGGIRQIVTRDGELVFTRLTPPLPFSSSPSFVTATLALDLQATLGYLGRLGLSGDEPLRLAALMPETMHKAIATLPAPVETVVTLAPHKAARRLGLPFAPGDDDPASDLLYAAWVARQKTVRPVLLPEEIRQARRTANIKRWGWAAAAVLWLTVLSALAWQGHGLFRQAQSYQAARQHIAILQEQWNKERTTLAPVTEPLGRLRQAVARKRLFTAPTPSPLPLAQALGSVLDGAARATRLNWQCDKDGGTAGTLDISLSLTGDTLPSSSDEAGRQAIIRRFDRLARRLRTALPSYEITVARYPFLVKTDNTLSNAGDASNGDTLPIADFRFREVKP